MIHSIVLASAFLFSPEIFEHATVAAYIVNTVSGEVVLDVNSQLSLNPSSTLKVVTTGAALEILGPNLTFSTNLEYDGLIEDGILKGNIYIKGDGDPCLGSDRIASSLPMDRQIDRWVDVIKKAGINTIDGEVIADDSKWDTALAAPSWYWEDLGNYYGVGASALSFNENAYQLVFKPGDEEGAAADLVQTKPEVPFITIHNEVITGPVDSGDRACVYGNELSSKQYIKGTIPLGVSSFTIKAAIPSPGLFCAFLVRSALNKSKVPVNQNFYASTLRKTLDSTQSPSVKEIVYITNQASHNLYAEHLLKKIGELKKGQGSQKAGCQAIEDYLHSKNIDLTGFKIVDGSGLSRNNLITVKQLVEVLCLMQKSEHAAIFFYSLPQKYHSIHAKSGSMTHIKGFAGYAGKFAFALLINQTLDADALQKGYVFLKQLDAWQALN